MAKEILIADPDKTVQENFRKIFETTDYHVVFSESGEDALLQARIFRPDLIFAGTSLDEKKGLELCATMKKDPEFRSIPFIIISDILEEVSDKDRDRVHADGVISKPIREFEVLDLTEQLTEERATPWKDGGLLRDTRELSSLAEIGETEEEIIELVDVVEEPESRISISDFMTGAKEGVRGEIPPLQSYEELQEEEPLFERKIAPSFEETAAEEETMDLQLKRDVGRKEMASEEELFEKIELEEILRQVEELKPSIEKEWLADKKVEAFEGREERDSKEAEKYMGIEEFRTVPNKKAAVEPIKEEIHSIFLEESEEELSVERFPKEMALEEETLEELPDEEFPEELLEEILKEEDIRLVEEPEEVQPQEVQMERLEEEKAPEVWDQGMTGPLEKVVDKHLEEVILKEIQEMAGDFVTKVLPEMTQHIIGLTVERIEKMVKEIVPDLAEKAIQEEIKRLQRGDKS